MYRARRQGWSPVIQGKRTTIDLRHAIAPLLGTLVRTQWVKGCGTPRVCGEIVLCRRGNMAFAQSSSRSMASPLSRVPISIREASSETRLVLVGL